MFVDSVSLETNPASQLDEEEDVGIFAHRSVKILDNRHCFSINGPEVLLKATLNHIEVRPMMSSCSVKYKKNADGSYEVVGEVKFKTGDEREKEKEVENNGAGKGSAQDDRSPSGSRDRDK